MVHATFLFSVTFVALFMNHVCAYITSVFYKLHAIMVTETQDCML